MVLKQKNGAFIFECTFHEKDIPKQAGFLWHPLPCYKNKCIACDKGVGKAWWTAFEETAINLIDYAENSTKEYLEKWKEKRENNKKASLAKEADIDIPHPRGLNYHPFQKAGIKFLIEHENALLADEIGLGKTIEVIGLINYLEEINKILIICPATMKLVWRNELDKWLTRKIPVIIPGYHDTIPQTDEIIIIVNYDVFSRKNNLREQIRSQKYDLLVLDEAHYLKHGSKTNRGKYILGGGKEKIKPIQATRNIFLTATPITNRPIEFWPLIHFLDKENWGNYIWYIKRYCNAYKDYFGYWNTDGASNLEELQRKLRETIMIRRKREDVLPELPEKTKQIIEIPAPELKEILQKEWEVYNSVKKAVQKARKKLEEIKDKESEDYKKAANKLKRAKKVAFEEIAHIRKETAIRKIPFVTEYLREILESQDKVVIFAHHKAVIDSLVRTFKDKAVKIDGSTPGKERMTAIEKFQNDPQTRIFIGSILACGTGITLTASNFVLFAELDWVPANMSQAEGRVTRIGQKKHVLIQYIVLEGSIDAMMAKKLVQKENIIEKSLD